MDDIDGDTVVLNGEKVKIEFLEKIREEKKFQSPLMLKRQLKKDKERCLGICFERKADSGAGDR